MSSYQDSSLTGALLSNCFGSDCSFNASDIRPSYRQAPRMLGWNVPPEELRYIPEHWLKYPEPDPSMNYLLGFLYIFLTIMSLVGNGLVIWIFGTSKSLRTSSNMFVISLAIADFIMMLKTPIFIHNSFNQGFHMGHFGCTIYGIMGSISGITQATSNTLIAYDRYKTISDPMGGRMSKGKALLMVALCWCWGVPWTYMPATEYWGRFVPEGYLTSCTFDYITNNMETKFFVFFIFIFAYCIPMFSTCFFYLQIVGHVIHHEKTLKAQAKKMNVESLRSGEKANASAEIRICKAAIGICMLFVISWTPYGIFALAGAFGSPSLRAKITPGLAMIPALCCKCVACVDPYVYAISHPRFRIELQKRLPWLKINEPEISDSSSTTTTATSGGTATTQS